MRNCHQTPVRLFALLIAGLLIGGCQTHGLVESDAWVQRVSTGHAFTEGPAWDGEENLYFTDIPNDRILRYNVFTNRTHVHRDDSGGANGLMFDRSGRLVQCEGGNRRVTRANGDGSVEVLANYTPIGKRLNSPNDLEIDARGGIYFTDPRYGDRESMEMKTEGVYYIQPDGEIKAVIENLERPNGLIFSLDQRTLYVADNARKTIWAYDVQQGGALINGRVFAWLDPEQQGGADGMTIDQQGNIYAAAQGAVWIWNSEGELLERIIMPENPSNVTFGGPDNRDLYVTARTSLYRIGMNVAGR